MYLGSNSTTDTEILTGHQKYIEAQGHWNEYKI